MKRRALVVGSEAAGQPLESFLVEALPASEAESRALVARGAVYVQGRRCTLPRTKLLTDQRVMVVLEEGGKSVLAPPPGGPARLSVLFEDAHLLAVDKPAGLLAQPSQGGGADNLWESVGAYLGRPAGLIHRLDRETSGVTVFAKTQAATSELSRQFREGLAKKRYLAVAGPGLPVSGTVDLPLSGDPSRPGRYRATRAAHGVSAVTDFTRLFDSAEHTLVALFPRTGRTHQLRAHLTALGAPILGDARYGGRPHAAGIPALRCLLHAQGLWLSHPVSGTSLLLEAPVPADVSAFFEQAAVAPPRGAW